MGANLWESMGRIYGIYGESMGPGWISEFIDLWVQGGFIRSVRSLCYLVRNDKRQFTRALAPAAPSTTSPAVERTSNRPRQLRHACFLPFTPSIATETNLTTPPATSGPHPATNRPPRDQWSFFSTKRSRPSLHDIWLAPFGPKARRRSSPPWRALTKILATVAARAFHRTSAFG